MEKTITKSDFLRYLECPSYLWFFKKKREVLQDQELSDFEQELVENGKVVESWARKLFPVGILVESREEAAVRETHELLEAKTTTIFQATFQAEDLYAMVDILEWDESGQYWIINEVKASSAHGEKKEEHLNDAAFQFLVLKKAGYKVGRVNLMELNKEFRKHGEMNPHELLQRTDITEQIHEMEQGILQMIPVIKELLERAEEPHSCDCIYKSRSNHCPAFQYLYPDVPESSVHDIIRIGNSKKTLRGLIDAKHYAIADIPEDFKLSKTQRNHVDVTQKNIPSIDLEEIQKRLQELIYPLYFLDYETFPAAVPIYDGCSPYQQVPFQYSLYVQKEPGSELEHYEYLHTDLDSHPMKGLSEALMKAIGKEGSIIVWNKKFEGGCHDDIADLFPEKAEVFQNYNQRFFDLMEIFSEQIYLHPEFEGGYSIKVVLPVLVPELSYSNLEIRDGSMAMNGWKKMMFETKDEQEKEKIKKDLLEYCKLDTFAMVKILDALRNLGGEKEQPKVVVRKAREKTGKIK
jgi:CRISPR/Cas system-associated exonuclease Cas4 (RecB family)